MQFALLPVFFFGVFMVEATGSSMVWSVCADVLDLLWQSGVSSSSLVPLQRFGSVRVGRGYSVVSVQEG